TEAPGGATEADLPVVGPAEVEPALRPDPQLVAVMDQVREIVSVTLGLRKAHRLRVRQPLRTLRIALADPTTVEPYTALVAAELNVKEVELLPLEGSTARRWGVT